MHRLIAFQNLASLAVGGGFLLPDSTDAVVSTLLASPGLRDLGLEQYGVPLLNVCTQYADAGGKPLALRRLKYRTMHLRELDAWPHLHRLTDLGRLETIELETGRDSTRMAGIPFTPPRTIHVALTDPDQFRSLRRLAVDFLDDALIAALRRVGQRLHFPPWFLSELFFETYDSHGAIKDGFLFHPEKVKYWPTCFVLGSNVGKANTAVFRQRLALEVSHWKALRLLHLQLDMKAEKV
jgi:hypothetical protein